MSRILSNRHIRNLFVEILVTLAGGALLSGLILFFGSDRALLPLIILAFSEIGLTVFFLYRYFQRQSEMIETASARIGEYLDGDTDARLESDEEGELYRLFGDINTLAGVLSAHAQNESRTKESLRNTIADISHQLKTPLAALNIYVGLLQEATDPESEMREFIDLSEQELDRIEDLVQTLLKMAKLDAGTVCFETDCEDLAEMMNSLGRRFEQRALQEEKTLYVSGDEGLSLFCDRTWLCEAIGNLIRNAFDHTKPGDTIRVHWCESCGETLITVADTGCGIHPEDFYHIFKRFYRSRFSQDTQGVGLGLPLAKAVIEGQGGRITVDSQTGMGAVFTVAFPIPDGFSRQEIPTDL